MRSPQALSAERQARLAEAAQWTEAARLALERGMISAADAALVAARASISHLRAAYREQDQPHWRQV